MFTENLNDLVDRHLHILTAGLCGSLLSQHHNRLTKCGTISDLPALLIILNVLLCYSCLNCSSVDPVEEKCLECWISGHVLSLPFCRFICCIDYCC